jgi:hypothetical protein
MNAHPLAYASFSLSGDQVVPEFWTGYFAVQPDTVIIKGQPFIASSGRTSRFPGRTSVWSIRTRTVVHSDQLEPHLRYLIERLALPRSDLRQLVKRSAARMRFFCYWNNASGDRIPDIPADIRALMDDMGGTVDIDEYR